MFGANLETITRAIIVALLAIGIYAVTKPPPHCATRQRETMDDPRRESIVPASRKAACPGGKEVSPLGTTARAPVRGVGPPAPVAASGPSKSSPDYYDFEAGGPVPGTVGRPLREPDHDPYTT